MSWGKLIEPNLVLEKTILSLTPEILQHYNLKGLVLDVDETLVPIRISQASTELVQWVKEIEQVAKLWLVSNNISQPRISSIANALNLPYIAGAAKPSRRKLRQAVVAMDLPVQQVGMVGDRLFTDVLAGNRLGMFTILVKPMVDPSATTSFLSLHTVEVWVSQALGVPLAAKQHNLNKYDKL